MAREFGIARIFLANELVDPAALKWISSQLDADEDFRFICYVDSVRGVELMDAALRGAARPLDVVVELAAGEGAPPACARRRSARRSRTRWPPWGRCGWWGSPGTRARSRRPIRSGCTRGCAG